MNKEVSISNPSQQQAFSPENPSILFVLICFSVNSRASKKQIGLNRDSTFGRESPLYWKRQRSKTAQLYEQISKSSIWVWKTCWKLVFMRLPALWPGERRKVLITEAEFKASFKYLQIVLRDLETRKFHIGRDLNQRFQVLSVILFNKSG